MLSRHKFPRSLNAAFPVTADFDRRRQQGRLAQRLGWGLAVVVWTAVGFWLVVTK